MRHGIVSGATRLALIGGHVRTMDPSNPTAEAIGIADGRVALVGTSDDVLRASGPDATVVELRGRIAIPGLVDAHVHLATDARWRDQVDVRDLASDVPSIETIVGRLRAAVGATPHGTWVAARGSPMQGLRLAEGRLPSKAELDAAVPEHPAYVTFGAHVLVANSAAIAARGIGPQTRDPDRGVIERDSLTGAPTGLFLERAGTLIKGPVDDGPPSALDAAIEAELRACLERGVTTIHDVVAEPAELDAYRRLRAADRLRIRVGILVRVVQSGFDGLPDQAWALPGPGAESMLWACGVKMSVDGGFTGGNAAFSTPIHRADGRGLIRITQPELDAHVARFDGADARVAIHAMGDAALDMALTAFERAANAQSAQRRHRIEHAGNWLATPERLARMARLGVVPVPNPSMHRHLADQIASDLGPERVAGAFDYAAVTRAGLPLVTGSDGPGYWPIDVLRDIGTMATRATRAGKAIGPAERVDVEDALRAQTATAAWLGFRERDLGVLRAGMLADVAVLDANTNLAAIDPAHPPRVALTIVGGRIAHEARE